MSEKVAVPACMAHLPVERGFVVPWFVANIEQPDGSFRFDHRIADRDKLLSSIRHNLCWLTGAKLGKYRYVVVSPLALLTRVTGEPPSVRDAAIYAAQVCPFLSNPDKLRRERNMPEGIVDDELMLKSNPGVVCVVRVSDVKVVKNGKSFLFNFTPSRLAEILWFSQGRKAEQFEIYRALTVALNKLTSEGHSSFTSPAAFQLVLERVLLLMDQYVGNKETLRVMKRMYLAEQAVSDDAQLIAQTEGCPVHTQC